MNKKGFEMSLKEIVELILVVGIIFATIFVGAKIYGLFVSNKVDPGTLNNFNRLAGEDGIVGQMLADNSESLKIKTSLMIANDYILVGFDRDCSIYESDANCPVSACESGDRDFNIPKPRECRLGSACLCLFNEKVGADFKGKSNPPINCYSYDGNVTFISDSTSNGKVISDDMADLVLYGSCEFFSTNFGIRDVFVFKEKKGNNVELNISAY